MNIYQRKYIIFLLWLHTMNTIIHHLISSVHVLYACSKMQNACVLFCCAYTFHNNDRCVINQPNHCIITMSCSLGTSHITIDMSFFGQYWLRIKLQRGNPPSPSKVILSVHTIRTVCTSNQSILVCTTPWQRLLLVTISGGILQWDNDMSPTYIALLCGFHHSTMLLC